MLNQKNIWVAAALANCDKKYMTKNSLKMLKKLIIVSLRCVYW